MFFIRGYTRNWLRHSILSRMTLPKEMSEVFLDALRVFWRCTNTKPWPFVLFDETSVSLCSFVGQVITLNFRLLSCHAVLSYQFFLSFIFQLRNTLFEADGTTLIRTPPKVRRLEPKQKRRPQQPPVERDPSPVPPEYEASVLFLWSDGKGSDAGEIVKLGWLCHFLTFLPFSLR